MQNCFSLEFARFVVYLVNRNRTDSIFKELRHDEFRVHINSKGLRGNDDARNIIVRPYLYSIIRRSVQLTSSSCNQLEENKNWAEHFGVFEAALA